MASRLLPPSADAFIRIVPRAANATGVVHRIDDDGDLVVRIDDEPAWAFIDPAGDIEPLVVGGVRVRNRPVETDL